MFYNLIRLIAPFVASLAGTLVADAAEIRLDPSGGPVARAVLEGEIEPGDFDKFIDFVFKRENAVEIYLASPGGNLGEAIKIGMTIRQLNLSTIVPGKVLTNQSLDLAAIRHNLKDRKANYVCASACFFMFVAGIHRSADDGRPAILAIHRPSLLGNKLKLLSHDQSVAAEKQTRMTVEKYLTAMDVPAKYAEEMYLVSKATTRWIRHDEFESDFSGFIPELRDLVNSKCGVKIRSSTEIAPADCERNVRDELALRAYNGVLQKAQ